MTPPPHVIDNLRSAGVLDIWEKLASGARLDLQDGVRLFNVADLPTVGWMANRVRQRLHGDRTYFNRNLHINATNVCEASCVFCSFARLKTGDANAWTLTYEQSLDRIRVLADEFVSEVHIVNGLNPDLPYDYYLELLQALKKERPELHCKGFTAVEIHYYAEKYGMSYEDVLRTMRAAGLDSMPGGGAEIFAGRARRKLCDDKVDAEGWLEVHRVAHRLGYRTNATMLFGSIETLEERVDHLLRLRNLQDESLRNGVRNADHEGGRFQTFIPLRFHNEHNRLARLASPTGYDSLRTIAVARLILDNFPHIKAYWPMLGTNEAQAALHFGSSDLDGTVREEHIYHMAGAETPQGLSRSELVRFIGHARRMPVERDTLYNVVKRTDPATPPAVIPRGARVGWVAYENAIPLTKHLEDVELRGGHPSEVARWLTDGEVDLALLPVGALLSDATPGAPRGWSVVPDVCIGAEGAVESVLIAAETPPEQWTRVLLDGVSRTSVLLARLLLADGPLAARVGEVEIIEVPPGTGVATATGTTATVVIGDAARALSGRLPYRVDLAEEWTAWTGLPFVFAVWAGRPDLDEAVVAHVRTAGLAGIAQVRDGSLLTGMEADLQTYLRDRIRFALDDKATMGLLRFAALAKRAGLVERETFTLYDAPIGRNVSHAVQVDEVLAAAVAGRTLGADQIALVDRHADTMDLLTAAGARRRQLWGADEAGYREQGRGSLPTTTLVAGDGRLVVPDRPSRVEVHFGSGESAQDRAAALLRLRKAAATVRAVTLVATPSPDSAVGIANNTGVQWLRLTALARLALPASIHIEGSWQRHGRGLGQVVLHAGADDFGAVLSAEKATEMVDGVWPMTVREAERNLRLAGLEPVVRDGDYTRIGAARTAAEPAGRPMRRLTPMAPAS